MNRCAGVCLSLLAFAVFFVSADNKGLFQADMNKKKSVLEKNFREAQDFLSQNKLQNVRGSTDLLEHQLKQIKDDISLEEANGYRSKIDKIINGITVKEDSLIKRTIDILHAQGPDSALQFTQNDLRTDGVSEKKISKVEKTILEEAPAIKQAQERDALNRTVKLLESGQEPDPSTDPYIVRTAQRMMKARADSVKNIQEAKARKDMEEQQRQERARVEQEAKEKKKEEERQAQLKKEEEKKRLAEQEAERKRMEAEEKEKKRQAKGEEERQKQLLAQQKKAAKDSIEAAKKQQEEPAKLDKHQTRREAEEQKEKDRQAKLEQERQKQLLAQQQKAIQDSLDALKKQQEQQAKIDKEQKKRMSGEQKEQDRQAKLEQERKKEELAQQQKAIQDSLEALKTRQEEQAKLDKEHKQRMGEEQLEQDRQAKLEQERKKQELAQQEKARKDSVEAARKQQEQQAKLEQEQEHVTQEQQKEKERQARMEEERQKQQLAQQEQARKDSIEAARKLQEQEQKHLTQEQQKEKDRQARLEQERQKQVLAQQEKARKDSLEVQRKQREQQALLGKEQKRQAEEQQKPAKPGLEPGQPSQASRRNAVEKREEQNPPPVASKSSQEYLQGLRDNQKKAQDQVMELYNMLDRNQVRAALDKFKLQRVFIAQFVDAQVFNVLEQTIFQSTVEAQAKPGAQAVSAVDTSRAKPQRPHEEDLLDHINGLVRDNKIEAAYSEFKRVEKPLKNYMQRQEFKQLKAMIENAYRIRKQGG
jgi:hypothetical protein